MAVDKLSVMTGKEPNIQVSDCLVSDRRLEQKEQKVLKLSLEVI